MRTLLLKQNIVQDINKAFQLLSDGELETIPTETVFKLADALKIRAASLIDEIEYLI